MSYGWIIVTVTLAVVLAIWVVGIYWSDMKRWWQGTLVLHDWERTRVREDQRAERRAEREARRAVR